MFLYIALVDLVIYFFYYYLIGIFCKLCFYFKMPQLPFIQSNDWSWSLFIMVNVAFVLGFVIMFLLVIFESHIQV
jgi:hypothetical protein